ncbi:MAG TPA: nucleotidyltransferase domain-containing protein [Actinomycetota bacterium]|nr:nucleotidyltransferase domain-containing protein [Actinomycetota bacterium]
MAGGGTAVALEDRRIAEAVARCAEALGVPIVSAYLFGSRAEGRAHRESDLDLAVLLPPGRYAPGKELFEIRVALASALMAELHEDALDLILLQEAPPHLARRIVTGGRRVFCADPDADAAFARDVQLRAADLEPFLRRTRAVKLGTLRR